MLQKSWCSTSSNKGLSMTIILYLILLLAQTCFSATEQLLGVDSIEPVSSFYLSLRKRSGGHGFITQKKAINVAPLHIFSSTSTNHNISTLNQSISSMHRVGKLSSLMTSHSTQTLNSKHSNGVSSALVTEIVNDLSDSVLSGGENEGLVRHRETMSHTQSQSQPQSHSQTPSQTGIRVDRLASTVLYMAEQIDNNLKNKHCLLLKTLIDQSQEKHLAQVTNAYSHTINTDTAITCPPQRVSVEDVTVSSLVELLTCLPPDIYAAFLMDGTEAIKQGLCLELLQQHVSEWILDNACLSENTSLAAGGSQSHRDESNCPNKKDKAFGLFRDTSNTPDSEGMNGNNNEDNEDVLKTQSDQESIFMSFVAYNTSFNFELPRIASSFASSTGIKVNGVDVSAHHVSLSDLNDLNNEYSQNSDSNEVKMVEASYSAEIDQLNKAVITVFVNGDIEGLIVQDGLMYHIQPSLNHLNSLDTDSLQSLHDISHMLNGRGLSIHIVDGDGIDGECATTTPSPRSSVSEDTDNLTEDEVAIMTNLFHKQIHSSVFGSSLFGKDYSVFSTEETEPNEDYDETIEVTPKSSVSEGFRPKHDEMHKTSQHNAFTPVVNLPALSKLSLALPFSAIYPSININENPHTPTTMAALSALHSHKHKTMDLNTWSDCFTPFTPKRFYIGIAVDVGFYNSLGSVSNVMSKISAVITQLNLIYTQQLGITVVVNQVDIRTATDSETWNNYSLVNQDNQCLEPLATLESFSEWRSVNFPASQGAWMLLTSCFQSPGIIGYGYIGVSCLSKHAVGFSSYTSELWRTIAHELGHILGANHHSKGGIMDVNSGGKLPSTDSENPSQYGFDSTESKPEMCSHIRQSLNSSNTIYQNDKRISYNMCWSELHAECGNGKLEEGEQCDPPSDCCTNTCKLKTQATCNTESQCCRSCQTQGSDASCLASSKAGFCGSNSQCVSSVCDGYVGLSYCGVYAENTCEQMCIYNNVCRRASVYVVDGVSIAAYLSPGSKCKTNSNSVCVNPLLPSFKKNNSTAPYTKADTVCTAVTYEWDISNLSACSRCFDGVQTRTVNCIVTGDPSQIVSDHLCEASPKPSTSLTCSFSCVYQYRTSAWTACVGPCGLGTSTRTVSCVSEGDATGTVMDISLCEGAGLEKLESTKSCDTGVVCEYVWVATAWSACDIDCVNSRLRTRTVYCAYNFDQTTSIDSSKCLSAQSAKVDVILKNTTTTLERLPSGVSPLISSVCYNRLGCVYRWEVGVWSECSTPCTSFIGLHTRAVKCYIDITLSDTASIASSNNLSASDAINDAYCLAQTPTIALSEVSLTSKPVYYETCTSKALCTFGWSELEWGACSLKCGTGERSKIYQCVLHGTVEVNTDGQPQSPETSVTEPLALKSKSKLMTTTADNSNEDEEQIEVVMIGGIGVPKAALEVLGVTPVTTGAVVQNSLCAEDKPVETESCSSEVQCVYEWFSSAWSTCSSPCAGLGEGVETRQVNCLSRTEEAILIEDNAMCSANPYPIVEQVCQPSNTCVFKWTPSPWSKCDAVYCDTKGRQTRTAYCGVEGDTANTEIDLRYCENLNNTIVTAQDCFTVIDCSVDHDTTPPVSNGALLLQNNLLVTLIITLTTTFFLLFYTNKWQ